MSVDPVDGRRSPFETSEAVRRLLQQAELLLTTTPADGPGIVVTAGSRLAKDSAQARPTRMEAFITSDLFSAASHVAALGSMLEAGTVYPYAPMTLLRSAIESAARARWLLEPTSRTLRVRRAVLRTMESLENFEDFLSLAAGEQMEHSVLRTSNDAACVRLGLDISSNNRRRELLKEVRIRTVLESLSEFATERRFLWKMCSAWSHNDDTTVANLSATSSDRNAGSLHVRVEPDEQWIDMCALTIGLDISTVLFLARDAGATWPGAEDEVTEAIGLFRSKAISDRLRRRAAQLYRR